MIQTYEIDLLTFHQEKHTFYQNKKYIRQFRDLHLQREIVQHLIQHPFFN